MTEIINSIFFIKMSSSKSCDFQNNFLVFH